MKKIYVVDDNCLRNFKMKFLLFLKKMKARLVICDRVRNRKSHSEIHAILQILKWISGRPIHRYVLLADISVLQIRKMLIGIGYWYRPIRRPISVALPIWKSPHFSPKTSLFWQRKHVKNFTFYLSISNFQLYKLWN